MHRFTAPCLLAAGLLCGSLPVANAATPAPADVPGLHARAVEMFRQARFPEAYGRFKSLADAGHAPAAAYALWMYRQGPVLFGSEWDITPDQLCGWSRLAGQAANATEGCVNRPSDRNLAGAQWQR